MSEEIKSIDKAKNLLKQLFRTENADLDFGIYRIMNYKRAEIDKFIDKDLIEEAEAEFKEFSKVGTAEFEKELKKRKTEINEIVPDTIGEDWEILKNHDLPKVKEFVGVYREYEAASVSEEQIQDVFNQVHEFFSRYYCNGDFIPQPRYGGPDNYFVPYNGEEVHLHWATKNLSYVKTGEYFNKYSFRAGRFGITFKVVEAQIEPGNVKEDKKYFILCDKNPVHFEVSDEVVIQFNFRTLLDSEKERYRRRTRVKIQEGLMDEALPKIRSAFGGSSITGILNTRGDEKPSLMRTHLNAYIQRNTKDFFIHKDLKNFLLRQLEFYLKNEVWDLDLLDNASDRQMKMLRVKTKAIRGISSKIIVFLSQIEDFQLNLFNKKKLVLETDYLLSLDLIPEDLYELILNNNEQIKEWFELYKLDRITKGTLTQITREDAIDINMLNKYKNMVIDTKYYNEDFKMKLLSNFSKLDDAIDGVVIKSDNYHALNLISKKYDKQITCAYIDPPFNTGQDGFIYKDNYKHSTWLSMIYDRVEMAQSMMNANGIQFFSINDIEHDNLRKILHYLIPQEFFIGPIIWKSRQNIDNRTLTGLSNDHEYILSYGKKIRGSERNVSQYKNPDNDPKGPWVSANMVGLLPESERPNCHYDLVNPDTGINYGKHEMGWRYDMNTMSQLIKENRIIWPKSSNGRPRRKVFLKELKDQFTGFSSIIKEKIFTYHGTKELNDYFGKKMILFPKPSRLINLLIEQTTEDNSIVLDYYAGSGTTADSVLKINKNKKQNRKFILIEVDNHIDTIIIPRLKKISFSENWDKGVPVDSNGQNIFIKYHYIEQYEDTLNNIIFTKKDGSIQHRLDRMPDYFVTYMLDYETKGSPSRIVFEKFKTPFNYKLHTISGGEEKEKAVDLIETFNYLLGLKVDSLRAFEDGDRLYRIVYGTLENEQVVVIWRDTTDLNLLRDHEFILETVLFDIDPEIVYINGDSYLENAKPIELEFKEKMEA